MDMFGVWEDLPGWIVKINKSVLSNGGFSDLCEKNEICSVCLHCGIFYYSKRS